MIELPIRYFITSKDILSDIFYLKGLSNRGRVTLIRQYTEIICRILLKEEDHFFLGKFQKKLDEKIPNAILQNKIVEAVSTIVQIGNAATHLDSALKVEITDKDRDDALENLNFVIAYLFIRFLNEHNLDKEPQIYTIISFLPPFLREVIWENLYTVSPKYNYADKLVLAILKSRGKEAAIKWVNINKASLSQQQYHDLLEKINILEPELSKGFIPAYKTFEEAKSAYLQHADNYKTEKIEVLELFSLMDFVFTGRKIGDVTSVFDGSTS